MPEFELVRRFGIEVYEVPGLRVEAVYTTRCDALFVKADLTPSRRQELAASTLSAAMSRALSPRRQ